MTINYEKIVDMLLSTDKKIRKLAKDLVDLIPPECEDLEYLFIRTYIYRKCLSDYTDIDKLAKLYTDGIRYPEIIPLKNHKLYNRYQYLIDKTLDFCVNIMFISCMALYDY